jgi:hypothetical protein
MVRLVVTINNYVINNRFLCIGVSTDKNSVIKVSTVAMFINVNIQKLTLMLSHNNIFHIRSANISLVITTTPKSKYISSYRHGVLLHTTKKNYLQEIRVCFEDVLSRNISELYARIFVVALVSLTPQMFSRPPLFVL